MVVDFHTHFFPDELAERALEQLRANMPDVPSFTDGTLSALLRSMDDSGVDKAVTLPVATKPSQVESINKAAAACTNDRIIPFGALHPLCHDIEKQISFLIDAGIKGIKLHPEYQDFHVNDPAHAHMYELAAEADLIAVFHAGWDPGPFSNDHVSPAALRDVHERHPRLTMVAAHMGGLRAWDDVERHLVGLPLYFDTSSVLRDLPMEQFVRIVHAHGAERVLFASDSPWASQRTTRHWIEQSPLSDAQKTLILCSNAQRVLCRPS
jgi:uncharacterized protein